MNLPGNAPEPTLGDRRFQFTGSLLESSFYLPRGADGELEQALFLGDYCHVVAPRQIGKTSLHVRVSRKLNERGRGCATVDLTSLGSVRNANEWYYTLIRDISKALGAPSPLQFWKANAEIGAARRWADYLLEIAAQLFPNGIVVFIDEIEAVLLSDSQEGEPSSGTPQAETADGAKRFFRDDFFMAIRSLYEGRNRDPRCRLVTFCLVGVTTPSDLVRDKKLTPYNNSQQIRLEDFTREQIAPLSNGLAPLGGDTRALLDAIYAWTDGHPYMTMRTCAALTRRGPIRPGSESEAVDAVIHEEFLARALEDPNLNYAARRFDDQRFEQGGITLTDKILVYDKLLDGDLPAEHVEDNVQLELRLAGMIKSVVTPKGDVLRVRNRVYARGLDREWLASKGERRELAAGVWGWQRANRDPAYLFSGRKLAEALERARRGVPLSNIEREFLTASQRFEAEELDRREAEARRVAEQHRAETEALRSEKTLLFAEASGLAARGAKLQRRLWIMIAATVVIGVVAAVVFGVTTIQTNRTLKAQETARNALNEANAREEQANLRAAEAKRSLDEITQRLESTREQADEVKKDAEREKTEAMRASAEAKTKTEVAERAMLAARASQRAAREVDRVNVQTTAEARLSRDKAAELRSICSELIDEQEERSRACEAELQSCRSGSSSSMVWPSNQK